jgi:hypothetical protein
VLTTHSSQILVGRVAILFVIVDLDLVVDATALTLTAAKRHVVLDPTVDLARGPPPRCAPSICGYEGRGQRWGQRLRIASLPSRSTMLVNVNAYDHVRLVLNRELRCQRGFDL